ncbi:MAG: hypothetical protein LW628_09585 [Fimbriimonadaceae bacterium]|nr:hypothetical protein [Fimbriimonadaceae bacterium]
MRKIIVGSDVVDGHLDTCATHCFVSSRRSKQLNDKGYPPLKIKPFPVGQGTPLPDATHVHLAPLWLISSEGRLVGFGTVLFLVSNTGADILISNNILDFLGILRYRPPSDYEQILQREAKRLFIQREKRAPPISWSTPESLQSMLRSGQCLITESSAIDGFPLHPFQIQVDRTTAPEYVPHKRHNSVAIESEITRQTSEMEANGLIVKNDKRVKFQDNPLGCRPMSLPATENVCHNCGMHRERCKCKQGAAITLKEKEPESAENGFTPTEKVFGDIPVTKQLSHKELRQQKINEANLLKVGSEPPLAEEVQKALDLLKRIAESPQEKICSRAEVEELQKELSKDRPTWAKCLTPANTLQATKEEQWARTQIEEMMDGRFKDTVFGKTLRTPCNFKPFEIHTKPGSAPEKAIQPRRFKDPKMTQLINDWVDGLLKDGLIRESQTPVAAPVTVVLKKGREPRVCIDYRERNARTDTPVYPMPDVHDFLDDAAGFKYYCSFDCAKMFNQYEIVPEHRYLAAFMTQKGTYEPNRIMFGVTGGPQHAVRSVRPALKSNPKTNGTLFTKWAIEQNLKGETPPYVIDPETGIVPGSNLDLFVDDCRIPADKLKGLVKLCELWFEFCEENLLILSRKKAKLCLTHLPFLGFVVSSEGKHLDPNRISSLLDIPKPTSKEGLHALLCSYNFVRTFIPEFSTIAAPLYAATKGIIWKGPLSGRSKGTREFDPQFLWTDILDRALRQLQELLLSSPILLWPDYSIALFLSVDACLKGEGGVLWQIRKGKDGSLIPVAIHYGSRKYSETESAWEVTRQEAHAIQSALKDVYDYIFSCHFYLLTDHRNLTFLTSSVNRAVIRIRHFMQQFNMTVVHVPGTWNNPADGISRLDVENLPLQSASDLVSATTVQVDDLLHVNRGQQPSSSSLEPGDYILDVGPKTASALFTYGNSGSKCPWGTCLLCNPTITVEPSLEAMCLFSHSDQVSETDEQSVTEEEYEWEISEQVLLNSYESNVLLTREQSRKEALAWNLKQKTESAQSALLNDQLVETTEAEWIPEMEESRLAKTLTASSENFVPTPSGDPSPGDLQDLAALQPQPQIPPTEVVDISTQTTPADFRAVLIRSPLLEDFKAIHNSESGHHGFDHSYRKLMVRCGSKWAEEHWTATSVREDLKLFIKNCPICQKVRGLQDKVKSKHSFISSRPFIEVSYDFIVFDTPDKNGNRYIIVAVDNFTKLVEMKAVPTRGAEEVATFLMELKARYGPINRLRSDREKSFTASVVSKLNTLAGTDTLQCIVYHPQANSVCERQNQIIMNHLRPLVKEAKLGPDSAYAWSDLLPFVFSIVNNTPKLPLAISPLSMVYGIFANYDRPLLDPRPNGEQTNPIDYVDGLIEWQNKLLDISEEIQSCHFEKLSQRDNRDKSFRSFQEGDFVLQLKSSTGARGKLTTRWIGPRLVLNRRDNDPTHPVLDLFDLVNSRNIEASIDDCRLFHTGWFDETTMVQDLHRLAALDKEEYEVEKILEHRPPGSTRARNVKSSDYWFKVKWSGFSDEENSWEPYSALKSLTPLEEYLSQYPLLKL